MVPSGASRVVSAAAVPPCQEGSARDINPSCNPSQPVWLYIFTSHTHTLNISPLVQIFTRVAYISTLPRERRHRRRPASRNWFSERFVFSVSQMQLLKTLYSHILYSPYPTTINLMFSSPPIGFILFSRGRDVV